MDDALGSTPFRSIDSNISPTEVNNPLGLLSRCVGVMLELCSSKSTKLNIPLGLTEDAKLSDSLWELYSPRESPDMDILFFHGLQLNDFENAFWKTWLARGSEDVMWPTWIAKRFPKARILLISYNFIAARIAKRNDFDNNAFGMDLLRDVIVDTKTNIGQNAPVFLVGHSLGGIAIKQFILSAQESLHDSMKDAKEIGKIENFIGNLRGVMYYGIVLFGNTNIGKLASQIQSNNPVLSLLKNLDRKTPWIMAKFEAHCEEIYGGIQSFALIENKPVMYKKFHGVLVPEASARTSICECKILQDSNHFSVCRATSSRDEVTEALFHLIRKTGILVEYSPGFVS